MNVLSRPCGPLKVNSYIVYNNKENALLIDPAGLSFVKYACEDLHIKISAIFLTHGHFDHIWDLALINDYLGGVPVFVSSYDEELLSDNEKNAYIFCGGTLDKCFGSATNLISDGDTIVINDICINVISTPGHTFGCVCYLIDNSLFTGDTLFFDTHGRTDLYGGSHTQMKLTLKRMLEFISENPSLLIYPGHGEYAFTASNIRIDLA